MRQQVLFKTHWKHRFRHGGILRNHRRGRMERPLSTKDPLHLVLKSNDRVLRRPVTYTLIQKLVRRYSKKFYIKIEQISIQPDHIHLLIRGNKRSLLQAFFRVLSGQIAQRMTDSFQKKQERKLRIWKYRPFSRVVKGWKAYLTVRNYIQLNEKEARGEIPYQKNRLRDLSKAQMEGLWA